jgi:outer membrane biosynthesis protein TonB
MAGFVERGARRLPSAQLFRVQALERRSSMKHAALALLTTSLALAMACGGSPPPAQPVPAGGAVQGAVVAGTPASADAGSPSTTTVGLDPNAGGTKLTPLANADGGAPKHTAELGRSIADIRAIVTAHRDEARACYDVALTNHPGIEGNLDIRWTIDPSGAVTEAEVDTSKSEILEPSVGKCVVAVIKKLRFNASAKGFETKAHFPFNFHPKGTHVIGDTTH